MSKGINKIIIAGNIGREPTYKNVGELLIAKFSVAVAERVKKGDDWSDHTEWVNCTAFGHNAKFLQSYGGKGSRVTIEGKIRTNKSEKNGEVKYYTECVVNELVLQGSQEKKPVTDTKNAAAKSYVEDDDIPF